MWSIHGRIVGNRRRGEELAGSDEMSSGEEWRGRREREREKNNVREGGRIRVKRGLDELKSKRKRKST